MCKKWTVAGSCLVAVLLLGVPMTLAAKPQGKQEPMVPLTADGQQLLAKYAALLTELQGEISKALPPIAAQQRANFMDTFAAESKAGKYSDANAKFVTATKNTAAAAKPILDTVSSWLGGDKLDPVLVKATVIAQATPRGLAAFAQQGAPQAGLIDRLLADPDLMKEMLVAGGAHDGNYGRTMEIYSAIQKASPGAKEGVLQRLALAVALDQVSAQGTKIDPLERYEDFEQAYRKGELDEVFPKLTTWELRMVVDEPYTDQEIQWVRQMIKNYRPDLMTIDYRWRYTEISPDEVEYTHFNGDIVPGTMAQKIIASGGVCGPRAWFGRLAARAFGIPVWGEQQPGHAAWTHWTPDGWIICQGSNWDDCHWYGQPGMDFYLESEARQFPDQYTKVLRAQWLGDIFGQTRFNGNHLGVAGFWPALGLVEERNTVVDNHPKVAQRIHPNAFWGPVNIPAADRNITVAADGTITIPAVATTTPANTTAKVRFMKSDLGGMQLHYARLGSKPESIVYTLDAPAAGKYLLTARVVTVAIDQELLLTVDDATTPVTIAVPYTVGMWGKTQPVEVSLAKGKNVFTLARGGKDIRGVTIKDFTLTPVR